MPTMNVGLRGGPVNPGDLRITGARKVPYVRFGPNARLYHRGTEIRPQTIYAMGRIAEAFVRRGLPCIWTSIVRAHSSSFSLHPFGYAVDADTDRELPKEVWEEIGQKTVDELGEEYDILVHNVGSGMHLHVEFDPADDPSWTAWKQKARKEWEENHA